MRNLIVSGFRMLFRHSRFVRITLIAALLSGIASGLLGKMHAEDGTVVLRPDIFIYTLPLLLLLMAVSLLLSIGQEQGSGAIRNKMIAGYSKLSVIGAWITAALCFSLLAGLLYLIPMCLLGGGALRLIGSGALFRLMMTVLLLFPVAGVFSALMSLLFRRQAFAAAGILGMTALCFVSALIVRGKLEVPEYETQETRLESLVTVEPDEHITVEDGSVLYDGERTGDYVLIDGNVCYKCGYKVTYVFGNAYYVRSPQREVWIVLNHLNPADAFLASTRAMMAGVCQMEIGQTEQYYREMKESLTKALKDAEQNHNQAAASSNAAALYDLERTQQASAAEYTMMRDTYADETRSLPQCMLAVLILMTAAGILVFRRLDTI